MYVYYMLIVKTNVADLASCQLSAILAKIMSFLQYVFPTAALGVVVKTLCRGRDKVKVYIILQILSLL